MDPNPYESPKADLSTDLTPFARETSFGIDRTWRVDRFQRCHKIRLRYAYWSGQATIEVDDDVIYHRSSKLLDFGLRYAFVVDGIPCGQKKSMEHCGR